VHAIGTRSYELLKEDRFSVLVEITIVRRNIVLSYDNWPLYSQWKRHSIG